MAETAIKTVAMQRRQGTIKAAYPEAGSAADGSKTPAKLCDTSELDCAEGGQLTTMSSISLMVPGPTLTPSMSVLPRK